MIGGIFIERGKYMAQNAENESIKGMAFGLFDADRNALILNLTCLDGSSGQIEILNPEGLIQSIERARKAQLVHERSSAPLKKIQPAAVMVAGWEV